MIDDRLLSLVCFEEGFRLKAYYCSQGFPTIGYGYRLGPKGTDLKHYTLRLTQDQALALLRLQLSSLERFLGSDMRTYSVYSCLDSARSAILVSMAFQLGVSGLLAFKKMWGALRCFDFDRAAREALDSRWAKEQSPKRAKRHAEQLRTGRWLKTYASYKEIF